MMQKMRRLILGAWITCTVTGMAANDTKRLFQDPEAMYIPKGANYIYAVDLFKGGKYELIVSQCDDAAGQTNVHIYDDFSQKKFHQHQQFKMSCPQQLVVHDFNWDGRKDIAVVSADGHGPLGINLLYGRGRGRFDQLVPILTDVDWVGSLQLGHFKNFYTTDLLAPYKIAPGQIGYKFISGRHLTVESKELDVNMGTVRALEFDGDFITDLVTTRHGNFQFLKGNGAFDFSLEKEIPVPANNIYGRSFKRDFNNDGQLDLGVIYHNAEGFGVTVLYGPAMDKIENIALPGPLVAVGDYNRDGFEDLLLYTETNGFSLIPGNCHGHFEIPAVTRLSAVEVQKEITVLTRRQIVQGDFNNDGRLDIIFLETPASGIASIFLGK